MENIFLEKELKELKTLCENVISQMNVIEAETRNNPKSYVKIQKIKIGLNNMKNRIDKILE